MVQWTMVPFQIPTFRENNVYRTVNSFPLILLYSPVTVARARAVYFIKISFVLSRINLIAVCFIGRIVF